MLSKSARARKAKSPKGKEAELPPHLVRDPKPRSADDEDGAPAEPTKRKRAKAEQKQTAGEVAAEYFRQLDNLADNIASGDADLDNFPSLDDDRVYVRRQAAYRKKVRHRKKLAKRIEERERAAQEQAEWEARLCGVERVDMWEHPFYALVAAKHDKNVPVARMFVAYERWTYCVSDNVHDRLIISQLVYWCRPMKWASLTRPRPRPRARLVNDLGEPEVAKTDKEMSDEIGVPTRTIEGRRKVLVRRGIIKVRWKKFGGLRTCHYSIDWDALADAYWAGGGDTNGFKLSKPSNVVHEVDDDDDDDE